MNKILLTVATAALTLILAADSQAFTKTSHGSTGKSGSMHGNFKDYHLSHGTKFEHGIFYRGKNHEHWGESRFDRRYGCNVYWDRGLSKWFYWCERDICYYPVTYRPYQVEVCQPVIVEPVRPVTTTTNVNVNVNVNVRTTTASVCQPACCR
jgi:hypothetical protein